jgi:Family of unknown function (DUF5708)
VEPASVEGCTPNSSPLRTGRGRRGPSVFLMVIGRKQLLVGGGTFAVGLLLWLFTGGVETPVITLTKVGVVLMVLGAAEAAFALRRRS